LISVDAERHDFDLSLDTGLAGATALVTGAASGIGRAIARRLAAQGVAVAGADVADLSPTLRELEAAGCPGLGITADLSRESDVVRAIHEAAERLGGINMFVNVAATVRHEPVEQLTSAAVRTTLDTNLLACMWACRELTPMFRRQGGGAVLIVGSTVVYNPAYREASYRVSKTGLRALMETLAIELAPAGVRVNMLTPGAFATGLTAGQSQRHTDGLISEIPLGRIGSVDEISGTAVLLLSDRLSPYTTGADFIVDGGLHLRPLRFMRDELSGT
jgi:NAD(P)-dependent dehydrogenase (short-subunit alcohol dehydrogenase family)